ncbi:MAG: helix-turn-helix domain-containing protein, partial [Nocardioides sp.]|nr:helix-turn-helix domain-containing protein [Nocardioides sp.]
RALQGDEWARRYLVDRLHRPLVDARSTLIETLAAYFASGGSLEATGRALFVHTNTVRYRLRQVTELTGFSPADPRDALALQVALILGRQAEQL